MISVEDETSSVINGRLRPRKSAATSPTNKPSHKPEPKVAQDKPKRNTTPSKASPKKEDDLTAKADASLLAQFLCPYCDRSFSSKQSVSKHARRIHLSTSKQDNILECLFCHHSEVLSSDIMRHMVDSHPNQYFACLDCNTRFPSTSQLATHKLNLCEKQKQAYRSKLRQKSSSVSKNDLKSLSTEAKPIPVNKEPEFNGVVISCELKPSQGHDEVDIEDKITTNFILPSNMANSALDKNALIMLDDIQWKRRIPPNVTFGNADADQILSRLGVVHRSPLVGESARRDCLAVVDHCSQLFEKCFDTKFYSRVASNVQENLARFLDGSYKFSPDPDKVIKTRKSKSSTIINTAEGFPILLPQEQYSRNRFDGYIPRALAPKHKWKWDSTENDKNIIIESRLIKRDNHVDNCIVTLISSLDIWTQLRMRRKYEGIFRKTPTEKIEKQKIIGRELKEILESRDIPCSSSSPSMECAASVVLSDRNEASDLPSVLGLSARAGTAAVGPAAVLSGEWVRPRCYVCCACGDQSRDARALAAHMASRHPNAQVQHYEISGQALLNADILRHLYVPPSQMPNRTRPLRGYRDCTKCHTSVTLEELHQHMLDCAGDTPAVRKKGRSRPFGVRRRRTRLPDNTIRKKIRKDMRTRHNPKGLLRTRPRIRTEVGDAESIRKMISGLPAKRHRQAAGQQQVLRPRRKIDKQRSKLKIKRLKKNSQTIQTKSDTNDSSVIDEDDQPLKPKLISISKIELEKAAPVRKRFSNRVVASKKRKESSTDIEVATLSEPQKDTPDDSGGSSQPQQISSTDCSQTVNFNAKDNDNRTGRDNSDNTNDNNNRDEREKPHDDNNGSGSDPALLKHSIDNITASSSTKSIQSVENNLPQQAKSKDNLHGTRRQSFLENEVSSSTPDKPPLSTNQKRSKEKKRASLLNCIEKIKSQKGETITDQPDTMSNYRIGSELAHTLMDPHPAVISRSRDESGIARNIVPEALVFGGLPTSYTTEHLGINEPLMLAPMVNPFYSQSKLAEPDILHMRSKITHGQERNESSVPVPNNDNDLIRYLMLQNQRDHVQYQLDTLASARPIVHSQISRSQDILNQDRLILQSQDLYKPPAHFSNSVFPLITAYSPDMHYESRPENVLRLNDETVYNLQQNSNISPLSQHSWRRETASMHLRNRSLQIPSMLPSMATNGLTPTYQSKSSQHRISESSETEAYNRIIDDTGIHYATPENSEDLRQLGPYSSHSDSIVLKKQRSIKDDTKAREAFKTVAYDTNDLAYMSSENIPISKPTEHYHTVERHAPSDIPVYEQALSADGHRSIPCSRNTIDSSHFEKQHCIPKSLYSRKKTMQIRYQEEHPNLTSLVPSGKQAAAVTLPYDSAVREFTELQSQELIRNDDTYDFSASANMTLAENNCVPYNEVISQQNTFKDQINSGSTEEPLDLSGKNVTIIPNIPDKEADSEFNTPVYETLNLSKRSGELAYKSPNEQVFTEHQRLEDQHTNMKAVQAPIGHFTNNKPGSSVTNAQNNESEIQHEQHTEKGHVNYKSNQANNVPTFSLPLTTENNQDSESRLLYRGSNNESHFTPCVEIENIATLSSYKLDSQITTSPKTGNDVTSNTDTPDRIYSNTLTNIPPSLKNQSSINADESAINRMKPTNSSNAIINEIGGLKSQCTQSPVGCYPEQNIRKDLHTTNTTDEHNQIIKSCNKQACDDNESQSIDQDSETVKKMAFFPKKLVDLLGAIPKDQHSKLVDAIAQFIPMTNKETLNPSIIVETPKGIIETVEEASNKTSSLVGDASKNSSDDKLTINIALLPSSSILPKKRHSPSTRLNTQDITSNVALSRASSITNQLPLSTTTPILDTNLNKTLSVSTDNTIEPIITKTNNNVNVASQRIDTKDRVLKTKPCRTTHSVEKQFQDQSNKSKALLESSEKTASLRAVRKTPTVRKSITDETQPTKPYASAQNNTIHDIKQTGSEISLSEHEDMKSTVDRTESTESHKNIKLYQPVIETSDQIIRESGEDNLENNPAIVTSCYVKNKTDSSNCFESVTKTNTSNEVNQLEQNNTAMPCNKENNVVHNIEVSLSTYTIESEIVSPRNVEEERAEIQGNEPGASNLPMNTKKQTKKLKKSRNKIKKSLSSICSIESLATQNETSNEEDKTLAELKIDQAAKNKRPVTDSDTTNVDNQMHNSKIDVENNLREKTESSMKHNDDSVALHSELEVHKKADEKHAEHKRVFGIISKEKIDVIINPNDKKDKMIKKIMGENNDLTHMEKTELHNSKECIEEVQIKANNESVLQNNTFTEDKLAEKMAKQPKALIDDVYDSCTNSNDQDEQFLILDSFSESKQTSKRSLRRSKRGKSMIAVDKDSIELVDTTEVNHDNTQTPKTKKQLIFSKLLQDGNLLKDKTENLISGLTIDDKEVQSNLAIETKTHKSSKRKRSSKTKTKKKKNSGIKQVDHVSSNLPNIKETDASYDIDNKNDANSINMNLVENSIKMQIIDSGDTETKKFECNDDVKNDSRTVSKQKRKSSNSKEGSKSKTKNLKLNIKNEKSQQQQQDSLTKQSKEAITLTKVNIDVTEPIHENLAVNKFDNGSVINTFNHKEGKKLVEKSGEMRTACYNRPIIGKQSSSTENAKHIDNYDPYDINMDIDMAEVSRPALKRKSKILSSTKTNKKVFGHDKPFDNIHLDSGTEKTELSATDYIPPVISDSDSSISDIPLQKYAEDKEKLRLKAALNSDNELPENNYKQSMLSNQANEAQINIGELHCQSDKKMDTDNNNKQIYESNVDHTAQTANDDTDLQQSKVHVEQDQLDVYINTTETLTKPTKRKRKPRGTSHNISKPQAISDDTCQQPKSEKCMDSCEIHQTKIHRKSNLMASKKITETFNLENEDDVIRKDRRRKSSQSENKKAYDLRPLPATQDLASPVKEIVTDNVTASNMIKHTVKDDSPEGAKKITEYKEVKPSENIPLMLGTKAQVNIEYSELRAEESQECNEVNKVDNSSALDDVADTTPTTPLSPEMPESPETLQDKPLMYPEEEVNIYEDKYDIIKRRREASANAKQVQKIDKPKKSKNEGTKKQKPERKSTKNTSKKPTTHSQVPTKGALKGFDAIKVSITTQDLNFPTRVLPSQPHEQLHSDLKKLNVSSGMKRTYSYNSDSDARHADTSDIYEFQDEEKPVTKGFRLPWPTNKYPNSSSIDEHIPIKKNRYEADNFRDVPEVPALYKGKGKGKGKGKRTRTEINEMDKEPLLSFDDVKRYQIKKPKPDINTKTDAPTYASTSEKTLNYQEKAANSNVEYNKTVTCKNVEALDVNGDTYDSEMEERETGRPSGFVPDTNDDSSFDSDSSSPSPLLSALEGTYACTCLSDIASDDSETERGCAHPSCRYTHLNAAKNAVMGKIFKNNAVRCDKMDDTLDELPKPKPDLDRLFDSLLEANSDKTSVAERLSPVGDYSSVYNRSDKRERDMSNAEDSFSSSICEPVNVAKRVFRRDSYTSNVTNSSVADASIYNFSENTSETLDNKLYIMVSQKHVQTEDPTQFDEHVETYRSSSIPKDTYSEDIFDNLDKVPESSDYIILKRTHAYRIKNRGTQTKHREFYSYDDVLRASKLIKKSKRAYKKHKSHHKRTKHREDGEFGGRHGSGSAVKDSRSLVKKNDEKMPKQECSHGRHGSGSAVKDSRSLVKKNDEKMPKQECSHGRHGSGNAVKDSRSLVKKNDEKMPKQECSHGRYGSGSAVKDSRSHVNKNDEKMPKQECSHARIASDLQNAEPCRKSDEGGTSHEQSVDECDAGGKGEQKGGLGVTRERRKCALGKQNVLAENWSSEESEDAAPPKGKAKKPPPKKKKRIPKKDRPGPSRARDSSSSDDSDDDGGEGPSGSGGRVRACPPEPSQEELDKRREQELHGWIVGNNYKRLVTMIIYAKSKTTATATARATASTTATANDEHDDDDDDNEDDVDEDDDVEDDTDDDVDDETDDDDTDDDDSH